jgi:hypothetical protein
MEITLVNSVIASQRAWVGDKQEVVHRSGELLFLCSPCQKTTEGDLEDCPRFQQHKFSRLTDGIEMHFAGLVQGQGRRWR